MSNEKPTEHSGFLDGREYTAAFLYEFCSLLVGNGVYADELTPTANNDNMTVTHGSGHAWINGVLYKNRLPFDLNIDNADGVLNRYDSLMLRLDLSNNETYATIVKGDFATSPTPPTVIRNAETFDLKICDIYVPAGCTKITPAQIIDTRLDASVCGVPTFPVEHLDTTSFYRQIGADLQNFREQEKTAFADWSNAKKGEILNLLQQLNELVEADAVGALVSEINKKIPFTGGTLMGAINMDGNNLTGLPEPANDTDAATMAYVNATIAMELLWENVSPTSNFSAQSLTMDLSTYSRLLVCLRVSTTDENTVYTMIPIGASSRVIGAGYPGSGFFVAYRQVSSTEKSLAFSNATGKNILSDSSTSITADATRLIPVKVYGIK